MAGFIQIIEFTTTRIDDIRALVDELRQDGDSSLVLRGAFTSDRDRPNTYVNVIEFESYETAMENSNKPETSAFASRMVELCDEPPTFRNLDVEETWTP